MAICKSIFVYIFFLALFLLCYYFFKTRSFSNDYKDGRKPSLHKNCDDLFDIARQILNGSKYVFKFRNRVVVNKTSLTWKKQPPNRIKLYNETKSKDIKEEKYFITFANNCCEQSKLKAVMSAIYPGGFDKTVIHDFTSLHRQFVSKHRTILNEGRGSGYWLWKPYIILRTLIHSMNTGDLLMYQDSGAYFIRDAGPLLKLCQSSKYGILLFYLTLLEQHYTKRDAFILMDMDDDQIYPTFQRLASFVLLQKNCQSVQFVMEWLAYASDPRILTDSENMMGKTNLPGFKEHRHDQSVLSLLSKKWGLMAYRTPSQYGNRLGYMGGPYSQLIVHNRNRN